MPDPTPLSDVRLRPMERVDWRAVAELIHHGTNAWYQRHARPPIFGGDPAETELFCRVYEALDPGCCVLAVDARAAARSILGSCFYHPRPTHVSLGIMNVHPDGFGRGIARRLLDFVVEFAEREDKPVRLVSSAINLDSFSLYTRAGFVPFAIFQDMFVDVPESGFDPSPPGRERVREASLADASSMAALERDVSGIEREKDYRYFLTDQTGIWHASVLYGEDGAGALDGFLVSVSHPASNMLGPGVARTEDAAAALIAAELDHHRGRRPVFLVPADCAELVRTAYGFGARNCELHVAQARGPARRPEGVVMPTFMPETG